MKTTAACTLDELIAARRVETLFQPIVRLDTGEVVAYEALSRGPRGSELESPASLFGAAEEAGTVAELDLACRAAAIETARRHDLGRRAGLFLNVEPSTLGRDVGRPADLDVVVEITERRLVDDPARLLADIATARELGYAIAIDDVGARPESLALMPVIDPDVVKLDMTLVQGAPDPAASEVARAVMAQAERTGAVILAEGIETDEHLARARALGARLGQGWLFGRPAPLPSPISAAAWPFRRPGSWPAIAPTPVAALDPEMPTSIATKGHLLAMSRAMERSALWSASAPIVVSTFQHARHVTPHTAQRYAQLVHRCSFVGAIGAGVPVEPMPGVRGSDIPEGHPLEGEWVVAVLGPFEAAALVARDLGDDGPDRERRFAYAITHRRSVVTDVVRATLAHIAAHSPAPDDGPTET